MSSLALPPPCDSVAQAGDPDVASSIRGDPSAGDASSNPGPARLRPAALRSAQVGEVERDKMKVSNVDILRREGRWAHTTLLLTNYYSNCTHTIPRAHAGVTVSTVQNTHMTRFGDLGFRPTITLEGALTQPSVSHFMMDDTTVQGPSKVSKPLPILRT